jgi:hypothetical protein
MTDINDFDDDVNGTAEKNPVRAHLRKVEEENKQLRQLAAEAEAAKKELAFVKAGVPMDHPASKYFIKGYDGEMTPEAIRMALEEANLIAKQQDQRAPEQDAWNRLQKASRAGERSEPVVDWETKINNASNEQEVMTILAQMRQEAENI